MTIPTGFGGQRAVLMAATLVGSLISYLAILYAGRTLGASAYGFLGALLAVFAIFLVPMLVASDATARYVAEFDSQEGAEARTLVFWAGLLTTTTGMLAGLVYLAVLGWQFDGAHSMLLLITLIAVATQHAVVSAVLRARGQIGAVALALVLDPCLRLTGFLLLIPALGVSGAMLGYLLGYAGALGWATLRAGGFRVGRLQRWRRLAAGSLALAALNGAIALFQNADVLAVRLRQTADISGLYAAGASLSSWLFVLAWPFYMTLLPDTIRARRAGHTGWPILARSLRALLSVLITSVVVVAIGASPILEATFGAAFVPGATLYVGLNVKTVVSVLTLAICTYAVGVGCGRTAFVLLGWAALVSASAFFLPLSAEGLPWALALAESVGLAVLASYLLRVILVGLPQAGSPTRPVGA